MLATFLQLSRIALGDNFSSIVLIINSSKRQSPVFKWADLTYLPVGSNLPKLGTVSQVALFRTYQGPQSRA